MSKMLNRFKLFFRSSCALCCVCVPQRFVVYGLTSAACFVCFFQRQTIYQSLYDIFDHGKMDDDAINSKCPRMISYYNRDRKISLENYQPWKPSQIQGTYQAFFIGFVVILIPGGAMADMYGGKIVMATGIALATLVTILVPTLTELGPSMLACGRLLQGVAQGLVFPSVSSITAQWAPVSERTFATGIIYSGQFFGWSIGYWIRFLYAKFSINWHVQFYVCAALGLVWLIFWTLFSFSNPSYSFYIKETELKKIKSSSKEEYRYHKIISLMPMFIPWKEIFCSFPLLSLIILNWASAWMHYTSMNFFKFYLLNVIGLSHELSNESVEIAHMVIGISMIIWALVIDWLINQNYMSRTTSRRFFSFASNAIVIAFLMGVLLAGCHGQVTACLYLSLCFCRGPCYASMRTNVIDLNPHFAGVLNGIIHCTGAIVAIFAGDIYNLIVEDKSDSTEWGYLFLLLSAILLFFSLPYLLLGSGTFQPWGLNKLMHGLQPSPSTSVLGHNTT